MSRLIWTEPALADLEAIYDFIASFYRKYIIKRPLNFFIKKYFKPQSEILHAGCGSGQVDTFINNYISI